jgi:hypothetical protein
MLEFPGIDRLPRSARSTPTKKSENETLRASSRSAKLGNEGTINPPSTADTKAAVSGPATSR